MKWWDRMPWSSCFECWVLSQLFHSPFTFIKRVFSSSSLSAIRVVSCAYLRLLIFFLRILREKKGVNICICITDFAILLKLTQYFKPTILHWQRRQWHPIPVLLLENPMDGGAWQAAVHGVAKSQTGLSDFTFTFHFHALEKEMATHSSVFAWRIPGTGGAWWAAVYGVAQCRTQLKRLSSSSSILHWKFKKKKNKKDSWESWPSGASPLRLSSPRPLHVETFSGHTASHILSASSCLTSCSSVTQAGVSASALWTREARSFFVMGCHAHCRIRLPH